MSHERMRQKVTAYASWFQKQEHLRKHPSMKTFRVVTITETLGRAQSLAAEYRSLMPTAWLAFYPVMDAASLTLENLMPELEAAKSA